MDSAFQTALFARYMEQARQTLAETEKQMLAPTYVVSEFTVGSVRNEESPLVKRYRWYVTRNEAYQAFKEHSAPADDEPILSDILVHVHQRGEPAPEESAPEEAKSVKRPASAVAPKPATNPFAVKLGEKKVRREGCMLSSTGREVMPLSVVSMVQEPGVEFKYHTGVDGSLEFTAVVPGMPFKERVKYMKKHKELFPEVPTRIMKLMGGREGED